MLSVAMMLRYSLDAPAHADRIEQAVSRVLDRGLRTADIAPGHRPPSARPRWAMRWWACARLG
jgi:isocitrate/isopropylmalate dehydrogenase